MRSAPAAPSFSTSVIARAIARTSPRSTLSASGSVTSDEAPPLASSCQQLPGNDESLNLAGPLADCRQLDVPEELFRWIVLHKTIAAVNLHTVVSRLHGDLARIQLGH